MSQRITRKEMKQKDQFVSSVEQTLDYSRSHMRTILIGVAAVAVVGIVIAAVVQFLSYRNAQASQALDEALKAFEAPIGEPVEGGDLSFPDEAARQARAKELFEAVRDDYGSTAAGDAARIYLAKMAVKEGDVDTARELWEEYVDRRGDDLVAAQLRLNLLDLERQQDGGEEAVAAKLESMLEDGDRSLPEDVVLYELAVTLEELSRTDEALTYYQRIVDEHPQSQYSPEARRKSNNLGAPITATVG